MIDGNTVNARKKSFKQKKTKNETPCVMLSLKQIHNE